MQLIWLKRTQFNLVNIYATKLLAINLQPHALHLFPFTPSQQNHLICEPLLLILPTVAHNDHPQISNLDSSAWFLITRAPNQQHYRISPGDAANDTSHTTTAPINIAGDFKLALKYLIITCQIYIAVELLWSRLGPCEITRQFTGFFALTTCASLLGGTSAKKARNYIWFIGTLSRLQFAVADFFLWFSADVDKNENAKPAGFSEEDVRKLVESAGAPDVLLGHQILRKPRCADTTYRSALCEHCSLMYNILALSQSSLGARIRPTNQTKCILCLVGSFRIKYTV